MLDQVGTGGLFKEPAGGNGEMLIYVRTSVNSRQSVRGSYRKQPLFWPGPPCMTDKSHFTEQSLLHTS